MAITKSPSFKYAKNFIIGVGAAIVMLGALYKIQSWEMPTIGGVKFDLLTIGLGVEAFLFFLIGILGPEPDYYWDKLYPGLSNYDASVMPLSSGGAVGAPVAALNGEVVEQQLGGMLTELQNMSKSMSSLKALQDADFSGTGEQCESPEQEGVFHGFRSSVDPLCSRRVVGLDNNAEALNRDDADAYARVNDPGLGDDIENGVAGVNFSAGSERCDGCSCRSDKGGGLRRHRRDEPV